jgi:thymidylate kinase
MFFARVDAGYRALALSEPARVRVVDGTGAVASVAAAVWGHVEPLLARTTR